MAIYHSNKENIPNRLSRNSRREERISRIASTERCIESREFSRSGAIYRRSS